ncbi:MAG: DinB family protein [Chloroflexota bacterium]
MNTELNGSFRYLDSDSERQQLVEDIHRVRQTVITLAETIPQDKHFEPRYHGWSLAALLTHLNTIDNFALFAIKLSLLGISPPLPLVALDQFNDLTALIFRQRLVATTIRGIQSNEKRIADFIMTLPVDRFSREVYHPPTARYQTVEQALQQYFLFHWQEHLQTLQHVDDVFYEPPDATTEI